MALDPSPPACPACGSPAIAKVLYGMPAWSPELEADLAAGRVVLGGCIVEPGAPRFTCVSCGEGLDEGAGGAALGLLGEEMAGHPVEVHEPALLITINQLYRPSMTAEELYEATRGVWRVGPRRAEAVLALAVYRGIVQEVYRIHAWYPAGTLTYRTRDDVAAYVGSGRWEFEGVVARDVRDRYVGRSVGRGTQNPVRYVNI
jgi:hypothetical protein